MTRVFVGFRLHLVGEEEVLKGCALVCASLQVRGLAHPSDGGGVDGPVQVGNHLREHQILNRKP